MQILQVCPKPPYPKIDGGCLAMAAITEAMLMDGHSVKTLCMSTHKHGYDLAKVPEQIVADMSIEAVGMDTRIRPLQAFMNLFTDESYNISRFYSVGLFRRLFSFLRTDGGK